MIPIQLLTLGHTVRVCYDLTNYAELSINSNGDLTIHKLVGGSPKIIDKRITGKDIVSLEVDSFGHPLNTPPTDRPLKVGDVLVAIDECKMMSSGIPALVLLNEYPIHTMYENSLVIESLASKTHSFSTKKDSPSYWSNYFTLKP